SFSGWLFHGGFRARNMSLSPRHIFLRASWLVLVVTLAGCGRFATKPPQEYVYVSAKGTFLRDRLAAVSNRIAEVSNGQRLAVIEHARRFVKVKTDKGEIGWIDEHAVIDQQVFDKFSALATQHAQNPVIAPATLRDDSYLHDAPGRQTEHYYLLAENSKLQLLARASVAKPAPPQAVPVPVPAPAAKPAVKSNSTAKSPASPPVPALPVPAVAPVLQDWWLVRDSQGHVGWVWSRMLDIDIPNEIAGLAEGQRYVGAYVLRTVDDPGSSFPDKQAPEYVALMNSWKEGMPYDFDQVRVFTWNTRKHRYETAYRQRNLEGYLPVTVGNQVFDHQSVPVFSFKVATGEDVAIDPQTGAQQPAQTEVETFRMDGVIVKRVLPPAAPAAPRPISPNPEKKKQKHKAEAKHRKKQ
ncbi:MAG TPA: SH3 domain-containing protein, partial [Silvibacterium sp.]|nr:SH3 domain-containing protein [Silvibacterium sp.]